MKFLLLAFSLLVFLPASYALDFSVACPKQVQIREEFTCKITLSEPSTYDVKLNLQKDGKNIAKIWSPQKKKWISSFYYLKSQFNGNKEAEIRAKINTPGSFEGEIILRKSSKKYAEQFNIEVVEDKSSNSHKNTSVVRKFQENKSDTPAPNTPTSKNLGRIVLGKKLPPKKPKLVYESKTFKALRYSPYLFAVFLILILSVVLLKR